MDNNKEREELFLLVCLYAKCLFARRGGASVLLPLRCGRLFYTVDFVLTYPE